MGARIDKYNNISGGFRAPVVAAWPASDKGKIYGVSINTAGQVVKGGASTAIRGIVIVNEAKAAGDVVDVMTSGEIIDFFFLNDGVTATVPATPYFLDVTTGEPTATAGSNKSLGFYVKDNPNKARYVIRLSQA